MGGNHKGREEVVERSVRDWEDQGCDQKQDTAVVESDNVRRRGFRLCSDVLRLRMIVLVPVFPSLSFVKRRSF